LFFEKLINYNTFKKVYDKIELATKIKGF